MDKFIRLDDFKFKDRFTDLTELQFGEALQMVNAQFSGVYDLWAILPPEDRTAKRELCINYLLAWQLMMLYPEQATGSGTGAIPLTSKRAGPISIKYRELVRQAGSGALEMLTTNQYGLQALVLLQTAPENYQVYK